MNVALHVPNISTSSPSAQAGGGLDLGVELAIPGARSVCCVEREAFAVAQLVSAMEAGLMAPAPIWSDARTFDGRAWRGAVDGLIGGIPCQGHSLAGKQAGKPSTSAISGRQRAASSSRPALGSSLLKTSPGCSRPGMTKSLARDRVLETFAELGFAVEGGLFTAAEVGAPHKRERIFILAVADSVSQFSERGRPEGIRGTCVASEAETRIRQRRGHDTGDGGECVADAGGERLQRRKLGRSSRRGNRTEALRSTSEFCSPLVGDADRIRECEPDDTDGAVTREVSRGSSGGPGRRRSSTMDNTSIPGEGPISIQSRRQDEADADIDRPSIFPPGPSDADAWRFVLDRSPDLEPSIRRMADGMAFHVDELRMLGNGVVPLEAAYALRTLVARLAARAPARTLFLVRAMGLELT
jgi:DNA (cytosine-5)-methyltransferase 1